MSVLFVHVNIGKENDGRSYAFQDETEFNSAQTCS